MARLREREARAEAEPLRERLSAWAEQQLEDLTESRPNVPDELGDRTADVWEPLLAIADAAGGAWPERARQAALELSAGKRADDDSLGVRVLRDIRRIYDGRGADRLATATLLEGLCSDEEAPWGDLRGRPLDARALARLLARYGIRPRTVRLADDSTPKGYHREQFEDAWNRYCAETDLVSATSATTACLSQNPAVSCPPHDGCVADRGEPANPDGQSDVADVAARSGRDDAWAPSSEGSEFTDGSELGFAARFPRLGEPGYILALDGACASGAVTEPELGGLTALSRLVYGAREGHS